MPRHKSNRSLPFHVESLEDRCLLAANVLDFQAGSSSSSPVFLGEFNNQLIVAHAGDASVGREVYVSDGSVAGTVLLADTQTGTAGAGFAAVGEVNGKFVFHSSANGQGQLWATDGTSGGTVSFANSAFDFNEIVMTDNRVFWIDSPNGVDKELWSSDGTAAGTQRALQLGLGDATLEVSGNRAYVFLANEINQGSGIVDHRMRVYSSNGTQAGTRLILDVDEKFRDDLVVTTDNGRIFFSNDTDLWTSAGGIPTRLGNIQDRVTDFREANGLVYFTVGDRYSNGTTWRSDGTSAGTFEFASRAFRQIIEFDGYTAFAAFSGENYSATRQQEWFTTTDGVDLEPVFTVTDYSRHLVTANSVWVDSGGAWTEILGAGADARISAIGRSVFQFRPDTD